MAQIIFINHEQWVIPFYLITNDSIVNAKMRIVEFAMVHLETIAIVCMILYYAYFYPQVRDLMVWIMHILSNLTVISLGFILLSTFLHMYRKQLPDGILIE